MKRSLLLLMLLLQNSCGTETPSQQDIIDGEAASSSSIYTKSTVALVQGGQVFCSGTLIDKRFVVTAAHCLENIYGQFQVGFGTSPRNFRYVPSRRHKMHPNYTGLISRVPADIGMVELIRDAPSGYKPVTIPSTPLRNGDRLTLAGFGQRENGRSGELYYTEVSVFRTYRENGRSHEFSYNSRNGACYGDSGGPAYIKKGSRLEVVGVTSRGTSEQCRGEGIYTDMRYYNSFINGFMNKPANPKPTPPTNPKPTPPSKPKPSPGKGIGDNPSGQAWCYSGYHNSAFDYVIDAKQNISVSNKNTGKRVAFLALNEYRYGRTLFVDGRRQPSFFYYKSGTGNRLFVYDDGYGIWLNHDGHSSRIPMECDWGAIRWQ